MYGGGIGFQENGGAHTEGYIQLEANSNADQKTIQSHLNGEFHNPQLPNLGAVLIKSDINMSAARVKSFGHCLERKDLSTTTQGSLRATSRM
jgi:hypothetical protein